MQDVLKALRQYRRRIAAAEKRRLKLGRLLTEIMEAKGGRMPQNCTRWFTQLIPKTTHYSPKIFDGALVRIMQELKKLDSDFEVIERAQQEMETELLSYSRRHGATS
jgi:hypothetical protein